MKNYILPILGLSLFLFIVFLFHLGAFPNIGLTYGYYGKFNRIEHEIQKIETIEIIDSTLHKDITLEDFSFLIRKDEKDYRISFLDINEDVELLESLTSTQQSKCWKI